MKISPYKQNIFLPFKGNHNNKYKYHDLNIPYGNDTFRVLDGIEESFNNLSNSFIVPRLREYIKTTGKIKETDIKGVVGSGGLSIVFDLGETEVLKVSHENPLEFRKHNPVFDIPFLSPVEKFKDIYIIREVKAERNLITSQDVISVLKRIEKEGFEPSRDLNSRTFRQIGFYKGEPYLLDTRCAMPKPNRFTRFVHNFCNNNRKIIHVKDVYTCDSFYQNLQGASNLKRLHLDETPRRNLSLKKGLSMMFNIIMENIKDSGILRKLK